LAARVALDREQLAERHVEVVGVVEAKSGRLPPLAEGLLHQAQLPQALERVR
jgi:hypothetical protein